MPPVLEPAAQYIRDANVASSVDCRESTTGLREWGHLRVVRDVRDDLQPRWEVRPERQRAARSVPTGSDEVTELFENLAAEWETQTMLESVVTRKAMNPSYQRIIGLGKPAVPLILARLAERPAQWFWALTAITGEDPAEGQTTVDGAAEAWLNWDRSQGLVSG